MLTAVLCPPTMAALSDSLANLDTALYQGVELRLDYCRDLDVGSLPALPLPAIMTLRSPGQGGYFGGGEKERLLLLEKLLGQKPAYLDVEDAISPEAIHKFSRLAQGTTLLLSHHNFLETPDLPSLLASMQALLPPRRGVLYKIACHAKTTLDALRMLVFCQRHHRMLQAQGSGLIGISMGEFGVTTRILAPVVHHGIMYCPVGVPSAPGQLDAHHLVSLYNIHKLNSHTAIYGLIGDPVDQSQGHIFHNALNRQGSINAVYVKWATPLSDLAATLDSLAALHVKGLSVTMPLKKAVQSFCQPVPLCQTPGLPGASPANTSPANTSPANPFFTDSLPSRWPICPPPAYEAVNTLRLLSTVPQYNHGRQPQPGPLAPEPGTIPCPVKAPHPPKVWEGTNTDGEGALRSLPFPMHGKTAIILGAGGAASALVSALHTAGAHCLVYNRSPKMLPYRHKTQEISKLFAPPLPKHDIIINTLPFSLDFPFERISFTPGALAFDISYAHDSPFLAAAAQNGCSTLTGHRMFEEQALLQRQFWALSPQEQLQQKANGPTIFTTIQRP